MKKTALITGASAGIGLACAEIFAEAAYELAIIGRRKEKIEKIASELNQKYNVNVYAYDCDVRNYDELSETIKKIKRNLNQIDVLINNAGLARGLDKIQDGLLSDWEEMIDTNVKGLLYVSKLVLPLMIENKSGLVINIGSIAGRELYPMGNVYCGTKHAVKAISKGMTIDLNGTGVRVCNIDPGMVETEFSEVRFHGDKDRANNVYKGFEPLIGQDIAEIALFVAQRPSRVMIQDILVTPTAQASATIVHKVL